MMERKRGSLHSLVSLRERGSRFRSFSSQTRKKGASHLGFILSFVIFITFLLFVYTTLEPTLKIRASKQPVLDSLRFSLIENAKAEDVTTMTITITGSRTHDCIKLTMGDIYDKVSLGVSLKIKDEAENVLSYDFQGSQLLIGLAQSYNGILKVYYGTGIDSSPTYTGPAGCDQVDSVTNFVKTESKILESNIFALKEDYENDCGETLKNDLGVPDGNDFTFSFKFANGSETEPIVCGIPNIDVYATTFPVEYLDENANSKIGFMTIKVW